MTDRVFVSHTSDMAQYPERRSFVQAALDAVNRAGMAPVDMRYFTAGEDRPAEYCRRQVACSDVFVAVVGFRYGSVVPGEKVSFTELEFGAATAAALPRLVFLLDEAADFPPRLVDADRDAVDGFRQRLRDAGVVVRQFSSDAGLELELFHALTEAVSPRRPPPPWELPPDVSPFTGRTAELAELDRRLAVAEREASPVVISAVSGTAGVGKTALAVHWAHQVARRFPDGNLYVDLRGYDPDQPMSAGDALAALLRALGVAGRDIPYEPAERASRYRTLLTGRRMLVILDNASSVEQVRLLLPGSPSCLVLVTSRDSLAALVARHGAHRVDLDLLPRDDAVALLRAQVGRRVDAEPDAAVMLAQQCARLPLALRVAAELAVSRPAVGLAELVGELSDEQQRLDLLDAGDDPRTAVRAVFSWSYRNLPVTAARAFRLLGLHPGPDIEVYASAALLDVTLQRAQHLLDLLTRAHLIQATSPGRYGMHDLLRAYATALAVTEDAEADRRAALTRLFDQYLGIAGLATQALASVGRHSRLSARTPGNPIPPVTDAVSAHAWLNAERATLVAVAAHAAAHGWQGYTIRLSATLSRYLDTRSHFTDAVNLHTHALRAARHLNDHDAEAHTLINLGEIYLRQGRYEQAVDNLKRALTFFREVGDRLGEASALNTLGVVDERQGRYERAVDDLRRALVLFREVGDRLGEARALINLAEVRTWQGRHEQALDDLRRVLALAREIGDWFDQARVEINLGILYQRQGQHVPAVEHYKQALALSRDAGSPYVESVALVNLGELYTQQGRHEEALDHLQESLALSRGTRYVEAHALTQLGNVYSKQGRHDQAAGQHRQALSLARELGDRQCELQVLNDAGDALLAAGRPDEARAQHLDALALARDIGDQYQQVRATEGIARTHDTSASRPADR